MNELFFIMAMIAWALNVINDTNNYYVIIVPLLVSIALSTIDMNKKLNKLGE